MTARARLFCLLLILITTASKVMTLEKRSDDTMSESLMTLVQQQAATIQAMQAQLASLQSNVHYLSSTISDINTNLSDVSTRLDTQVFFTAHMTKQPVAIGTSNSPLKFNGVVTNEGGAYNPSTGVFTAPVSGVYVFYAQLMKHASEPYLHWAIVNSDTIMCVTSVEQDNAYDKSSCLATAHVQKGDTVFVRRASGTGDIEGAWYCSFSGYLTSMDRV